MELVSTYMVEWRDNSDRLAGPNVILAGPNRASFETRSEVVDLIDQLLLEGVGSLQVVHDVEYFA